MSELNEVQLFLNELRPVDVRRDLADLFDGFMQNENEQCNFTFENISRKNYVVRRLGELLDYLESHDKENQ